MTLLVVLCSCQAGRTPPSFAACNAVTPEPASPIPGPLHTDGAFFKDAAGRVVSLRGVNLAGNAKVPPFAAVRSDADLDPLPGWGLNSLRLLFTWEAFEPQPCRYDEDYLASIERTVSAAEARGLYVLIDFHQDAFSRFSLDGCGDGFPEWAVLSSLATHAPDNGKGCDGWGVKLTFDGANLDVWRAFHRDTEGARTRYLQMVSRVATRLSSHANVIGYDLINEPWGEVWELHALFEDVGAALRAHDPSRLLVVPAHALGYDAPRISLNGIAHAPHYYDQGVYLSKAWGGGSVSGPLDQMLAVSTQWGAPMLLTEFGANEGTRDEGPYLEAIYSWLDANFVSGMQWNYTPGWSTQDKDGFNAENYSITDDSLTLRGLFTPRPSPQKTAGTPLKFQRDTHGFTYRWQHDPTLGATEVFVLDGQNVVDQSGVAMSCVRSGHTLSCTGSEAGETTITVSD
jgi:endoglycosylceramidase